VVKTVLPVVLLFARRTVGSGRGTQLPVIEADGETITPGVRVLAIQQRPRVTH
jgi:hypothetical protein